MKRGSTRQLGRRSFLKGALATAPLLLAGPGSVLSLDAAITDWAGRQASAARRRARRNLALSFAR